ncbi:MAG: polyprenyl synthetase family protein [Saprospiraceae bacterium]|nr:polyprenyl synthetase family protein [Saprospiraceae bacterium]
MRTLPEILQEVERFAEAHPFPDNLPELYEPCHYMLKLGGKRLRPALTLMACEMMGGDINDALPAAWAVELFHNFSLIHDDIMDAAPLRRGQATVHTKWNQTTGILSGDVMLIYAWRFLAQHPDATVVHQLLKTFNRVATEVCEGQQLDVNFESAATVQIPDYIKMIELKTAVLLGGALEMGGICAKATPEDIHHLYEFGRLAGIAFQIQDDYLDTFGDPVKFGKQTGGDILQNKKTLLVLKTLERASEQDRNELMRWLSTSPSEYAIEKIRAVKDIFTRYHIPQLMISEQQGFQENAFRHLDAIQVNHEAKQALRGFIADLFVRQH